MTATPTTTTNNYGIDRSYVLGMIQTWNADLSRDFGYWNLGAGYVGTRGSDLDMLRAPNRGPDGLLLADVQAFTWQAAEGRSILAAGNFRVRRRPVKGIGFGATYTLARSRDNTTATGGNATVAQDDQNLDAEWALSSFDRRHQFAADISIELPFGQNRPWLNGGGFWATLLRELVGQRELHVELGHAADPASLGRGGRRGARHQRHAPRQIQRSAGRTSTIRRSISSSTRSAFTRPLPGEFGNALRNMIVGPGNRQLNATFSRDLRMGRNRSLSLQLNATNLFNMVQWSGIDTNVNSLTFGQVTSVRPMRSVQLNLRFRF